ncbi:4-hydroxythreonine-4-phosphate dehydrogenase PdxA [Pararhodobacter zhoushanensis]|uniref:4-hydroxythreonine-4-phosphate dehydrogenase PdxA n=1 Tax=Pararhodobacter zhoushanensis TaxID=2479545 RepID=UPI0013DF3C54|nr:4-hydroxythreonine-4-phosphate dehydrogenase PdxA [Pararhodobacter zhoushanensis]
MTAPLAVTCGDPSGVGPELAARIAAQGAPAPMVWIGDPRHLPEGTRWQAVGHPSQPVDPGALAVLPLAFAAPANPGHPDPANAAGTIAAIERAVALLQDGACSAVVTAPINKKALKDGAGFAFPGHTEFLAHLAGGADVVMMLACPELRVVPATIHIALTDVPQALTADLLRRTIAITRAALIRDFGLTAPRIAVAGLNPHAGEGGAMGREELSMIAPLLAEMRAEGFDLQGPLPADTMFHAAARARYDAAVCMYHDQALIPIKTIDFSGGVNVTLGLPFVRTSPDHGTAYDIAGQGLADPTSMRAAMVMAWEMAQARG